MALESGTRLGSYEIIGAIGAGGMGEVYRARDTALNRDVAIKVMPEELASDGDRLARFQREAEALAALNHPNIAQVYGLERSAGSPAIVMEFVEGDDLSHRIAQGAMPVKDALPIARQIAEALEAAHEAGIIHRDLKPANVKVRDDGTVKVLDFGLAKAMDPVGDSNAELANSPTLTARATQLGVILGTAAYMAPEQAKGKPVDRRADVWAFGVVLFEMLSGTRAFEGSDVSETLASVLAREPDWSALPAGLPAPIVKLLRQCLQKDRRERTPDIAVARFAIREALEATATAGTQGEVAPAAPAWRQPITWIAVVVTAVLAAAATWGLTRPSPEPARVGRFVVAFPPDSDPGNVTNRVVAVSPDGTHIALVANRQIWLRRLADLELTRLTPNETQVRSPFFSPDGRQIGFASEQRIKRVDIAGGSPVDVGGPVPLRPFGVNWAEDGFIYVGMADGIARLPATGGSPETVVAAEGGERLSGPQLLPGGEWLLFGSVAGGGTWDQGRVVAESLLTHERKILVEGARMGWVTPTGHLLYVSGNTLFGLAFDRQAVALRGGPVSLVDDVRLATGTFTADVYFDVSAKGDLVYLAGGNVDGGLRLVWDDRRGGQTALPLEPANFDLVRLSPDGRRIAVAQTEAGQDLWLYGTDRAGGQRVTSDGLSTFPVWSSDGEWLYYAAPVSGGGSSARTSVWRRRADLSGEPEELLSLPGASVVPTSVSDVAGRVAVEVNDGSDTYAGFFALDAPTEVTRVSRGDAFAGHGALSPDGAFMAYMSTETTTPQIYVQELSTGRVKRVSVDGAARPVWARDGEEIFFHDTSIRDLLVVKVVSLERLEFTIPEVIGQQRGNRTFDVSADGERLLLTVPEQAADAGTDSPEWQITVVLNWFEELKARVPVK